MAKRSGIVGTKNKHLAGQARYIKGWNSVQGVMQHPYPAHSGGQSFADAKVLQMHHGAGSNLSKAKATSYLANKQHDRSVARRKTAGTAGRTAVAAVGAGAAAYGGYKAYKHFQARKHGDRDYSRVGTKRSSAMRSAR